MSALVGLTPTRTEADNWGHWRGDNGNGVASNANPPTQFDSTNNVKWKIAIQGQGSGSPVVWGEKIFVTSAVPVAGSREFRFHVYCVDRGTGKILWDKVAVESIPHEGTHSTNGFASGSPCTDGTAVYAFFGSRGLFAYSLDG